MVAGLSSEINFQFSRSGGKGGQNVNKVETAVTGVWNITASLLADEAQKAMLLQKLQHRITANGELMIRSQRHRSQLANRDEVVKKFQELISKTLTPRKPRIATKPGKQAKEKRLDIKKRKGEVKKLRGKVDW